MGLKLARLSPSSRNRSGSGRSRSPSCRLLESFKGRSPSPPHTVDVASPQIRRGASTSSFLRPAALPQNANTAVLSWNISAINNNPFEYWLAYDDPDYDDLMRGVECVLDEPGECDLPVGDVFTEAMFEELMQILSAEEMSGLEELKLMWRGGEMRLAERCVISEFVQDATLGAKRLISMPDRITNTINVVTREETVHQPPPVYRPSVINNYEGDLSSMSVWWEQWKKFMFKDQLTVRTSSGVAVMRPIEMLGTISRTKYPAVTELEERISVPLQVLCLAIFDSVIMHLMNELSPDNTWQKLKQEICDKLYRNKNNRIMDILAEGYENIDIMCLQEVAGVFADIFRKSALEATHTIVLPEKLDSKRDQNSVIILRKNMFVLDSIREVTGLIASYMPDGASLANGDLLAVEATGVHNRQRYLIVSFHGDTNGLMSLPFMHAVKQALDADFSEHWFILGLDANTYLKAETGKQSFDDFVLGVTSMGLLTCWGEHPKAQECITTCTCRTSLQPQLNKAVRWKDRVRTGMDPKDHIIFSGVQFSVATTDDMGLDRQANPLKDNTGDLEYKEKSLFPTLTFPSDHGILSVVLKSVA